MQHTPRLSLSARLAPACLDGVQKEGIVGRLAKSRTQNGQPAAFSAAAGLRELICCVVVARPLRDSAVARRGDRYPISRVRRHRGANTGRKRRALQERKTPSIPPTAPLGDRAAGAASSGSAARAAARGSRASARSAAAVAGERVAAAA
eukprot:scaffold15150_cov32-Tisochrysis_lutea.AAC.4